MRFGGVPINGPAGTSLVSIVPGGGVNFTVNNAQTQLDSQFASETILGMLRNARVWGASIVGTAAAANKAIAELNNPAASGTTVYVYSEDVFVPVAMAIQLVLDGTTLAPVGTGVNLSAGGAAGVAKVGGGNQLAPTGSLFYTTPALAANADYAIPQPWLVRLPAAHNLQLIGQTVNQAFTCNVRWYEISN